MTTAGNTENRANLASDEGSVTVPAAVLAAALLLVLALVVDGGARLRATSRADSLAAEAARAAVSAVDLRGPTVVVDRPGPARSPPPAPTSPPTTPPAPSPSTPTGPSRSRRG